MDSTIASIVLFASWLLVVWQTGASPEFGPFTIKLKEINKCDGVITTNQIRMDNWRMDKINTTGYVYNGNVILEIPVTDEMSFQLNMAVWGNGGWRENFLTVDHDGACRSAMKYMPILTAELLKRANVTSCPVPPGTYDAASFPLTSFKITSTDVPSFQYGLYRCNLILIDGDTNVGCLGYILDIVPRKKKG